MDEATLRDILERVRSGQADIDNVIARLRQLPFEQSPAGRIDHHRRLRCGCGEVIYCAGKSVEQVQDIFARLAATGENVLATRASAAMAEAIIAAHPTASWHEVAGIIALRQKPAKPVGHVAVISAGTSDMPVAEEARLTAELLDARVTTHYDVGVAGLHRLLADLPEIHRARAIVVVAGMEGALASVVGGLVAVPVLAVPTSVGYGASFGGIAALLAMLNSCASGVTVVNIDNGFAAGYTAALINRQAQPTHADD
jgi:hypothetical protein